MVEILVIITEIALVALFGWLSYTLYLLAQNLDHDADSPDASHEGLKQEYNEQESYAKVEGLAGAQIFAGIQIMDAKRQGLVEKNMKQDWILHSSALYFMGATQAIAGHFECCMSDTHEIMRFLLTRNLQIANNRADRFIQNFDQHTVSVDDFESCESGRKAAISWLKDKFTPDNVSLIETIRMRGIA